MKQPTTILSNDELRAFTVERDKRTGPFFFTVDHASNRIPKSLGTLGLPNRELQRHIAYDIGALDVAKIIAEELSAPLIYQNYSRLVVDCNRRTYLEDAIPEISEYTSVPGNMFLSEAEKQQRIEEIHSPYHQEISDILDNWQQDQPIYVAIHSCTPEYKGVRRDMEIGVLYGEDSRYAKEVLACLRSQVGSVAAENEPYFVGMDTDYGIPKHAEERDLLYVEIEFRQDLVSTPEGVKKWASILKSALLQAKHNLEVNS